MKQLLQTTPIFILCFLFLACQQAKNNNSKVPSLVDKEKTISATNNISAGKVELNLSNDFYTIDQIDILKKDAGLHNIASAEDACKELQNGWRLPNSEELTLLFEHSNELGDFTTRYYLGLDFDSNENNQKVVYRLDIMNGDIELLQSNEEVNSVYGFRPVRNHQP